MLCSVFDKLAMLPDSEKESAVKLVVSDTCLFALLLYDGAVRHHASINASSATTRLQHEVKLKNRLISTLNVVITCCELMITNFGNDPKLIPLLEIPADCAIKMQTRQVYVSVLLSPQTLETLLEWIGKFNPEYVAEYKKKQNKSMVTGTIFLLILGAIFLTLGIILEGTFAKWFCIPMAVFCLGYALFRIFLQIANSALNK